MMKSEGIAPNPTTVESSRPTEESFSRRIIRGSHTNAFIEKHKEGNPRLETDFENIAFRFEGHELDKYPRAVIFYPGVGRSVADKVSARNEFWETWMPQLGLKQGFAQVEYSNHTFVREMLYKQVADLVTQFGIKEVDLVGMSFGAVQLLPQAADFVKEGVPVDVKTISLMIPGITYEDVTDLGKKTFEFLDKAYRALRRINVPSGAIPAFTPHLSALAVRSGSFPDEVEKAYLPPTTKVIAFIARNDEIFDPQKTEQSLKALYPSAKIVGVPGGHYWDPERIQHILPPLRKFVQEA